jgi:hypothetical protein
MNFGEFLTGEVRRIPLLGTWVNKGGRKGRRPDKDSTQRSTSKVPSSTRVSWLLTGS